MTAGLIGTDLPLAEAYDLALVDLDGVAYRGPLPIDHAADGLTTGAGTRAPSRLRDEQRVLAPSPSRSLTRLTTLGIPTQPRRGHDRGPGRGQVLETRLAPGRKVLVIGGAGLRTAVTTSGFTIIGSADDEPDAVVQGLRARTGWTDLAELLTPSGAGPGTSRATSTSPCRPPVATPGQRLTRGGRRQRNRVTPDSAGKPSPRMYELAVERAGAERARRRRPSRHRTSPVRGPGDTRAARPDRRQHRS